MPVSSQVQYRHFSCFPSLRKFQLFKENTKAYIETNRPFPSSKNPHSLNEAKCKTPLVKMSFICSIIKNHFQKKGILYSMSYVYMYSMSRVFLDS